MKSSTTVLTQKRRGPKPTGKGELIGVRLQPQMLAALDKFVDDQSSVSRPEAIRLLLRDHLISLGYLEAEE